MEDAAQVCQPRPPMPPGEALALLKEGNIRHKSGQAGVDNSTRPRASMEGQWPLATILCCSDSRVPPEIVFDQGPGQLFIVRVAGNIVTPELLASVEYATMHSTSRLIVVMGHECCGAVTAAVQCAEAGSMPDNPNMKGLLSHLLPVVDRAREQSGLTGGELVETVATENAADVAARILEQSPDLAAMVADGALGVVWAKYSIATGEVSFGDWASLS